MKKEGGGDVSKYEIILDGCKLFSRSKTGMHLLPDTEKIIEYLRVICEAQNRIGEISEDQV